jgi:dihydroorotate dehydrogenase/NAD-dependent dihydropyrimidine dehydrogenase PreA subunit
MLGIDFLGHSLKNPLMLTEGPLSGTESLIKQASESEAGLIFTKGIRPQIYTSPVPFMKIYKGSLINADWSCIGFDEWIKIISRLEIETPLVVSIAKNYVSSETAVSMAERLVKAGAKIISFVDYDPVQLEETVKLARPRIKVPIMVKLTPFLNNLEEHLNKLVLAGIDAIAAMDSIGPVLTIDTKTGAADLGSSDGSGYISGKYILPVTLRYIYEITQIVDVPVVGVGGVTDTDSALQMIMAGATGVGMVTAPLIKGLNQFKKVSDGLIHYFDENNIKDLSQIRGLTHNINRDKGSCDNLRAVIDELKCNSCGICKKICYSGAISINNDRFVVSRNLCTGCGLCFSACPVPAIEFK